MDPLVTLVQKLGDMEKRRVMSMDRLESDPAMLRTRPPSCEQVGSCAKTYFGTRLASWPAASYLSLDSSAAPRPQVELLADFVGASVSSSTSGEMRFLVQKMLAKLANVRQARFGG